MRNWSRPTFDGLPAHAGVLGQPEDVAGGAVAEQIRRQRQRAGGTVGRGLDAVEVVVGHVRAPDRSGPYSPAAGRPEAP